MDNKNKRMNEEGKIQVTRAMIEKMIESGVLDMEVEETFYTAVDATNQLKLWEWITTFTPDGGFLWSDDERVKQLKELADKDGLHSGASLAITLRMIQYVANHLIDLH
jgi:hypothetical protein